MKWFRFHAECLDNPKIQKLSPELFRSWVNLMCVACLDSGFLPPASDIAFRLRISEINAQKLLKELQSRNLIDSADGRLKMHSWHHWQFESGTSDSSAERMRRLRARHKERNGSDGKSDVTRDGCASVSVSGSGSESEKQEKDAPKPNEAPDDFAEFMEACETAELPASGTDMTFARIEWSRLDFDQKLLAIKGLHLRKQCGEFDDPGYRPHPQNYLSKRNWERPLRQKQTASSKNDDFWKKVSQV